MLSPGRFKVGKQKYRVVIIQENTLFNWERKALVTWHKYMYLKIKGVVSDWTSTSISTGNAANSNRSYLVSRRWEQQTWRDGWMSVTNAALPHARESFLNWSWFLQVHLLICHRLYQWSNIAKKQISPWVMCTRNGKSDPSLSLLSYCIKILYCKVAGVLVYVFLYFLWWFYKLWSLKLFLCKHWGFYLGLFKLILKSIWMFFSSFVRIN